MNAGRIPVTDWKDWRDVFASETIIPGDSLGKLSKQSREERASHVWRVPRADSEPMYLDKFCVVKRLDSRIYLDVIPTPAAIEALTPHVTFVDGDTMNFEVIEWQDGRSLIVCRNNRIIAGPWLAKINSVTIPHFKLED